jgi:hypothetical protein
MQDKTAADAKVKKEILSTVERRFLNGVHVEPFTPRYTI